MEFIRKYILSSNQSSLIFKIQRSVSMCYEFSVYTPPIFLLGLTILSHFSACSAQSISSG